MARASLRFVETLGEACRINEHHFGEERRQSAEEKAERIITEELHRIGWTEQELELRPKGDPAKMALARRLRQETTVSIKWIAHRLQMGTSTHLNHPRPRPRIKPKQTGIPVGV